MTNTVKIFVQFTGRINNKDDYFPRDFFFSGGRYFLSIFLNWCEFIKIPWKNPFCQSGVAMLKLKILDFLQNGKIPQVINL